MLMAQLNRTFPQRDHTSLNTNSFELCPIELVSAPSELFKVNVRGGSHLPGVNLQDTRTSTLVGEGKLDFAV